MIHEIGNTPLILLNNIPRSFGINCQVYAKCEFLNPASSATDRIVKEQLRQAPKSVLLSTGYAISEGDPDTCLSTAWLSRVGKLNPISIPSKATTQEKVELLKSTGSSIVVLFDINENGKKDGYQSIEQIKSRVDNAVTIRTWVESGLNPFSIATHWATTGKEIQEQLHGLKAKMIVCGGEAGGMIFGTNMRLRQDLKSIPKNDELISIGVDFSTNTFHQSNHNEVDLPTAWFDFEVPNKRNEEIKETLRKVCGSKEAWSFNNCKVSEWVHSTDADSFFMARRIAREEGLLVGPSCGAVLSAALKAIERYELKDDQNAIVVVIFNSSLWNNPRNHLSNKWMLDQKFFKESNMEALYWWHGMPLMTIKCEPLLELPEECSVSAAIDSMKKIKATKAIVLDSNEIPIGVVTSSMLQSLNMNTLSDLFCTNMKKIDSRASISELAPLLENYSFAIIVQTTPSLSRPTTPANVKTKEEGIGIENNNISSGQSPSEASQNKIAIEVKENVLGILDTGDMIRFQRELEKHHEVSYGLTLSDGIPNPDWYKYQ